MSKMPEKCLTQNSNSMWWQWSWCNVQGCLCDNCPTSVTFVHSLTEKSAVYIKKYVLLNFPLLAKVDF